MNGFSPDLSIFRGRKLQEKTPAAHLGQGAFASVRHVVDQITGEEFALKIVKVRKGQTSERNTQREIRLHSKMSHQNIVKLVDFKEVPGFIIALLELVRNGTLFNYLSHCGALPEPQAAKFFAQTCQAVEYIHSLGIIHRDIKPENILLDENNNVKLCDFGWSAENAEESGGER